MNYSIIRRTTGLVLKFEAIFLLLPALTGFIYRERAGFIYLILAIVYYLAGTLINLRSETDEIFYTKEGFFSVALVWIVISICGALPFVLCGDIPSYPDALFETISGFTTTGSSILPDVEALSHASLFWRSFTHWVGGMGVLVFIAAILPISGDHYIHIMRAEVPGPEVSKLVPRARKTARILYMIYFLLTAIEIVFLLCGGMSFYDALLHSFATAGTGGFSTRAASVGAYNSTYIDVVISTFMLLFGCNFNLYYLILMGQGLAVFKSEELRVYLGIIAVSVLAIAANIASRVGGFGQGLRYAYFQVTTIISTTGFATADFDTWPELSRWILVLLMFVGGMAGSTGGGIKVSRILVLIKTVFKELNSFLHPKSIKKIKMDDKPIEHEVVRATNVYFCSYMIIFAFSVLLISLENYDLTTNFTAVAATFNNIGPGLELVGPAANFSFLNSFSKCILIFDMLAGRLELFPLLILFHPVLWKEVIVRKRKIVQSMNLDRKK